MICQNSTILQIATVTYGGVAMSAVSGSPLQGSSGDEPQTIYVYFLGSSIPTGVQNFIVDTTSTSAKSAVGVTLTAAADTEIDSTVTQDIVEANPSVDLATTASTNTWVAGALASGQDALAGVTPDAAYTQMFEQGQVGTTQGS